MNPIKIYINSFNRLSYLQNSVTQLREMKDVEEIVIVDNDSGYPPLLEYLNKTDVRVVRMGRNAGPRGAFDYARMELRPDETKCFATTDPDLDFADCPKDLLSKCMRMLDAAPTFTKVGPSIRLDDIPKEFPWYDRVMSVERGNQTKLLNDEWYNSAIDTTFAVYRTNAAFAYYPALRACAPYQVRHLPYYFKPGELTDEDIWYTNNLPQTFKHGLYWSTLMQDEKEKLGISA